MQVGPVLRVCLWTLLQVDSFIFGVFLNVNFSQVLAKFVLTSHGKGKPHFLTGMLNFTVR